MNTFVIIQVPLPIIQKTSLVLALKKAKYIHQSLKTDIEISTYRHYWYNAYWKVFIGMFSFNLQQNIDNLTD